MAIANVPVLDVEIRDHGLYATIDLKNPARISGEGDRSAGTLWTHLRGNIIASRYNRHEDLTRTPDKKLKNQILCRARGASSH
jgi:hypothetical protein